MRKKITTLKIGPIQVPVYEDSELEDFGSFECDPEPTIRVSKRTGVSRDMTILHEVLHAISDQYGLDLNESKVRVLEQTLTQLVADNPAEVLLWARRISNSC